MDSLFGWAATALTTYLAGRSLFEDANLKCASDVFACPTPAQALETDDHPLRLPGGFPVSPPCPSLKRGARKLGRSHKRSKLSTETNKSRSSTPTKVGKKRRGKAKPSSKDFEASSRRPVASTASSCDKPSTILTSAEDNKLGVQTIPHAATSSTTLCPAARSTRGQPLSLVPDNVVAGRKRSAPAEFDEDITMPHRKKYIIGWMSEYIRLRASSWRTMLRVMQEARWRPFRPQVIRYLAPAPPSAPSCHGCVNPTSTGDLPVTAPIITPANPAARTPSPPLPPPGELSPILLTATTTPTYSPQESPLPFIPHSSVCLEVGAATPPSTPPPSSVAYSLMQSAQDCISSSHSTSRTSWVNNGEWRANASPEQPAYPLGQIAAEDPTSTATDLPPSIRPSPIALSPVPFVSDIPPKASTHSPPLLPPPCPLPYAPLSPPPFPPSPHPSHAPTPVIQGISTPPAGTVPTPRRFKTTNRDRHFKPNRQSPYKMDPLRLQSEVKCRLVDLGAESRPTRPSSPVRPIPIMIGSIPALQWPTSVFNSAPPGPVGPTPWRNNAGESTRLWVHSSMDSPKRAYRSKRRRLNPDEPMEGIE